MGNFAKSIARFAGVSWMLVLLFSLTARAEADPFVYKTAAVTKAGCSYTSLYSQAKVKMYFGDIYGKAIPAGSARVPYRLIIQNDSKNLFYYSSPNVRESTSNPKNYVSADLGNSYFTLSFTGNGANPNFSIPINIAFLSANSAGGTVGGGTGGSGGTITGNDLHLTDPSWRSSGNTLTIEAAAIANRSTNTTSGSLKVQVWATNAPYKGVSFTGYPLGSVILGALKPGYRYLSFSAKTPYTAPPKGNRYVCIILYEQTSSGYVARDYKSLGVTKF